MSSDPGLERVSRLFHEAYGTAPTVVVSAPGRVNLIGEHLDYNGGPVLPFAIDRRTWIAAGAGEGFTQVSRDLGEPPVQRSRGPAQGHWSDYLAGVQEELSAHGWAPAGARIAVHSEIPPGAGLSSSAALTVGGAAALGRLAGHELARDALVDAAFRAEYHYVGVRCGRMDQTIIAHGVEGSATLYDTATERRTTVPFPYEVWIIPTGVAHKLADGGFNARRSECEEALRQCRRRWPTLSSLAALDPSCLAKTTAELPEPLDRRVRHVVTEVERTREAARVLAEGDLASLGQLLVAGHDSLRVDFESTVPEADELVELLVERGAHGARLTGAGWGGSVIMLAPEGRGAQIADEVGSRFAERFGRLPASWKTRAAGGVRLEAAS